MKTLTSRLACLSLLSFLLTLTSNTCFSQEWNPVNNGLYGGNIKTLFVKDDLLFAGTDVSGIFKTDNTLTWNASTQGLNNRNISAFCASGDSLFVGTFFGGVHLSLDNGQTWTPIGLSGQVTDLLVDNGTMLASTVNGIFKSDDMGQHWNASSTGLSDSGQLPWINTIEVDNNRYYAGAAFAGLFVSDDAGENWERVDYFSNTENVVLVKSFAGKLIVGTRSGLFASINGGMDFFRIDNGIFLNTYVYDLIEFNGKWIAATSDGLYSSPLSSTQWTLVDTGNNGTAPVNSLIIFGDKLLMGDGREGVKQSTDGTTWTDASDGLTAADAGRMVQKGNDFYATTSAGAFHSPDKGETWHKMFATNIDDLIAEVAVKGDSIIGSTSYGRPIFSLDSGATWSFLPQTGLLNSAYLTGVINNKIYVATQTGLFVLEPGEETWRAAIATDSYEAFMKMSSLGDTLVATTWASKVYVSTDNGKTWAFSNTGLPDNFAVMGCTIMNGKIYITMNDGIFKSEDAGVSWTKLTIPVNYTVISLASDNHHHLFAGTFTGVYISINEGETWTSASDTNLTNLKIESLTVVDNDLYACTTESIYKTSLGNFVQRITSFSPSSGPVGTQVTLTGTNFSPTATEQTVTINGLTATITLASTNFLVFSIPEGATSGNISVSLNGITVESDQTFCIGEPPKIEASPSGADGVLLSSSVLVNNQWFFNDQAIEGATGQTIVVTDPGAYKVRIQSGVCTFEGVYDLIITGIENGEKHSIAHIYPIPATTHVSVDLTLLQDGEHVQMRLFDSKGTELFNKTAEGNKIHSISLAEFSTGVYFLQTTRQEHIETIRILKE